MAIPIGLFNGLTQGMNYMSMLAQKQMQQHQMQQQQMTLIQYKNQLESQRAQELQETINRNTRANLEFETKARQTQADELDMKHFEHEKTLQDMKAQSDMDRLIYEKKHEKGPAPEKYTAANAVEMRASYLNGKQKIDAKYSDDKFIGPLKQQLRSQGMVDPAQQGQYIQKKKEDEYIQHGKAYEPVAETHDPDLQNFIDDDLKNSVPRLNPDSGLMKSGGTLQGPKRPTGVFAPKPNGG